MIEDVLCSVGPQFSGRFAFFGHSMGALVAYETAKYLAYECRQSPQCLFVSGRPAPDWRNLSEPFHTLPQGEFIKAIMRYNGAPAEVWDHAELTELLLPTLRADFAVCETYIDREPQRVSSRIIAMGGEQDPDVTEEQLNSWARYTQSSFESHLFSGDHFFINHHQDAIASIIKKALSSHES